MKRYLRLHKADKHEGIKYSCGDCKFHAAQQQTLRQHKESKHEGIRYICTQCDYKGRAQSYLINHQPTIHEGINYACDQCDYLATHVDILKLHQINKHVLRDVSYSCDQTDSGVEAGGEGGLCLYDGCIVSKQAPFIYTGANFLERGQSFNERVQQ